MLLRVVLTLKELTDCLKRYRSKSDYTVDTADKLYVKETYGILWKDRGEASNSGLSVRNSLGSLLERVNLFLTDG